MAKVVVFDGPDAVGKSTQLALAKEALEKQGKKVHATRTPGGTPIGEELRGVVLSHLERPPETDLHIYWAINLALGADIAMKRDSMDYILVDRGPLSFLAYQVFGSGLDRDLGMRAANEIMELWRPDMLLMFDAPLEITKQRLQATGNKLDYFESKDDSFHAKVLDGYKQAAATFPVTTIDAIPDAETVHEAVMRQIMTL